MCVWGLVSVKALLQCVDEPHGLVSVKVLLQCVDEPHGLVSVKVLLQCVDGPHGLFSVKGIVHPFFKILYYVFHLPLKWYGGLL